MAPMVAMPHVATDNPPVAPWPIGLSADLRPADGAAIGSAGTARRLPSLPPIGGNPRNTIALALLLGAAGFLALRGAGGDEPAPAPTPATQAAQAAAASANWAGRVPKPCPADGDADALSLDQRELRPARMRHQLELAIGAMKPGEVIRQLTVRNDGTLALSVVHGTDERTVVTKGTAPAPTPGTSNAAPAPILAIDRSRSTRGCRASSCGPSSGARASRRRL